MYIILYLQTKFCGHHIHVHDSGYEQFKNRKQSWLCEGLI